MILWVFLNLNKALVLYVDLSTSNLLFGYKIVCFPILVSLVHWPNLSHILLVRACLYLPASLGLDKWTHLILNAAYAYMYVYAACACAYIYVYIYMCINIHIYSYGPLCIYMYIYEELFSKTHRARWPNR